MIIYLASTIGTPESEYRQNSIKAKDILELLGYSVIAPWETKIPGAWDISNKEWGLKVFHEDIKDINRADCVIVLSYGRESTAGANWECGYAYGIGKKVIVVEMTSNVMSLMVSNGAWAVLSGLNALKNYDFVNWPKEITETEQK